MSAGWSPAIRLECKAKPAIPEDLYRQAMVDRANTVQRFYRITLPLLRPVLVVTVLFRSVEALRVFDLIFVLTGGGPGGSTLVSRWPVVEFLVANERGRADYDGMQRMNRFHDARALRARWVLIAALAANGRCCGVQAQLYRVGQVVEEFTLTNRATGEPIRLSDFAGKIVFLEWFAWW